MKKDTERSQMIKAVRRERKPGRNALPLTLFLVIVLIAATYGLMQENNWIIASGFILAFLVSQSVKVAQQWEKAVVLRLGKFHSLAGPGLFFIIPIIDTTPFWIDQRIIATSFNAEQTLTKDNVPVDVDAVLFWMVWDAEKAALEVEDYREAVSWAAQTALRDVIGRTMLSEMLAGRENIDSELQEMIDKRTVPWGVAVQSVEIRDVIIPEGLQDAMSREAQADRERKARIILGSAEQEIAASFVEAANIYGDSAIALQLRSLNVLYESLKKQGGLVVVPSQMADATGLGACLGIQSQLARKPEDNKVEE
ncbi:SPFH domain-containing protein [Sporomusa acidovorans]|uniref:Band 7 domain-containing protein n=1 Tax=Sporomusa acidovorans (strain ATCC 49682 / DSM 3132 / Mol) TaxID=1123286 RepID=A0ABZ3J5H4_SPOA4|nr:SPFH domain-containing protein [Sporomusa acidovorans]OZC24266.1 FtsH protease regulator HflK [Sporomusa acidovorans DSM 3132]SDF03585.1 SPFH domain, Band 7 family protein [Sporomusa acidovorans]